MRILLANPRGFCAGVDRAISIVERALELYGAPIYVRHEVVHNRYVVNNLRERGAIFIEEIAEVPDNAILIFSAHGVSQAIRRKRVPVISPCCLMPPVRWLPKCIWKWPVPAAKAKRRF